MADVDRDAAEVATLREELADPGSLWNRVEQDVREGREALQNLGGGVDGLQRPDRPPLPHTRRRRRCSTPCEAVHRQAQVESTSMTWPPSCERRNRRVADQLAPVVAALGDDATVTDLGACAADLEDRDQRRLLMSYLPLAYSRRHGDPSRPWNWFEILVEDEHGNPRLRYEGNWRDIFQNWEALAYSYPELLPAMTRIFLDATTVDGYNPYRVSTDGVDWEVPDPDDPWSNIGYWSDHQIVYLLRLLQASVDLRGTHVDISGPRDHVYADVPYRIADHASLLRDPRNSITFDSDAHEAALARESAVGADGRLLHDDRGHLVRASADEKLLVLLGAKLVNLVPGGGIWMNTQRPEWNDANNALAGYGVSVVTAAQLLELCLPSGGQVLRTRFVGSARGSPPSRRTRRRTPSDARGHGVRLRASRPRPRCVLRHEPARRDRIALSSRRVRVGSVGGDASRVR